MNSCGLNFAKKPNFFILGAAKCGTTSLYQYLKYHPDIYMSPVKEPCFFCETFQIVKNPVDYARLFEGVESQTRIGEASHVYLTSPSSAKTLRAFFPDALFLIILRHPADRAYSLYHHMRRYGYETIGSFEKALAAEEKRFHSRRFRKYCNQYFYNFLYFRSGLFAQQIKRYFEIFDCRQFYFLTLDGLREDPGGVLGKIFDFLGVKKSFTPDIKVYNKGLTSRSARLEHFLNLRLKKPLWARHWLLAIAEKYNMKTIEPMDPDTRKKLSMRYEKDLAELFEVAGIRFEL
jgi:hypothetical protein